MIDSARIRLLDETLREGDSRGYHRHPPERRLKLLREIHEVTGIEHFSLGFAVVNDSDRETLQAFLEARRQGTLPKALVAHVYGWYQIDERAHQLLESIPAADRAAVAFHFACSASEVMARPTDGPWLLARTGAATALADLATPQLHQGLQEAFGALIRRYGGYRLHSVGAIVQDAFRCSEEELDGYVAAAEAAGCTEVRLHDTVGTATPLGVAERMDHLHGRFGRLRFGVHFHDDLGMAVANTVTALARGAAGADVTVNGIGNRAGNASAAAVLMALQVVHGVTLPRVAYARLSELALSVERHYVMLQSPHAPVTGRLLHLDEATIRTHLMRTASPLTFLPYDPAQVGGHIGAALGPGSGRRAIELAVERAGESLRRAGLTPDASLVDRAWAWAQGECARRAEAERPRALAAMEQYQAILRGSYVTDDDVLAMALASKGSFART